MVEFDTGIQARRRIRSLEAGVVSGARIFMEASLEGVKAWDLDANRERRIAIWVYSLGAVDALSKFTHLDRSGSLRAAIDYFSGRMGIDAVAAAMLVASLQEICEKGTWAALRDGGEKAMADWLSRSDEHAPARLRDLLDSSVWPSTGEEADAIFCMAGTTAAR